MTIKPSPQLGTVFSVCVCGQNASYDMKFHRRWSYWITEFLFHGYSFICFEEPLLTIYIFSNNQNPIYQSECQLLISASTKSQTNSHSFHFKLACQMTMKQYCQFSLVILPGCISSCTDKIHHM